MTAPDRVTGHATMSSAIQDATNYHQMLIDLLRPHINGRVLEIGPGYGQYTTAFTKQTAELVATDIDQECVTHLQKELPQVTSLVADLNSPDWTQAVTATGSFQTVIALNVLEHIENDAEAVKKIYDALTPGGSFLLVVPAHPTLYGEMDRLAAHYRRYDKKMLSSVLQQAGFHIDQLSYINPIGGLGWWVNSLFYKPSNLSTTGINFQILFFDKYLLPISTMLTPITRSFFGQSVWCCAKK